MATQFPSQNEQFSTQESMLNLKRKKIFHHQGRGMLTCMFEKVQTTLTEIPNKNANKQLGINMQQ